MATLFQQGGIALFWRGNNSYEVEEIKNWGPNVFSLHLMIGNIRFFVVGCNIPSSNLETLMNVNNAWRICPTSAHLIVVGNLNINLCAMCTGCKEMIAKQVDAMDLVDLSRHFYQCLRTRLQGQWMWRMRREGKCISSQCGYFLGRETNHRRFQFISV